MPEHQQIQQSSESKTTSQRQATPRIQTPVSHPMAIIQRARIDPKSLTHADVMQLQRTIGNRAVVRLLSEIGAIPSKAKQASPVQRQELVQKQEIPEEEEPLQGKMAETVQRQEIPEEEEPLQGKFENKPELACPSCFVAPIVQRQEIPEEEEPLQGKFESIQRQEIPEEEEPLQTKEENNTGMPDNLKAGVESLSEIDMSDVRVQYNSSKPAEVGALAYTQGTEIHVAPGQERHLPHEAWHVVQQKQGRVSTTGEVRGLPLNDSRTLESEADLMGRKALQMYAQVEKPKENKNRVVANPVVHQNNRTQKKFDFLDNLPELMLQNSLQLISNNSQRIIAQSKQIASRKAISPKEGVIQREVAVQIIPDEDDNDIIGDVQVIGRSPKPPGFGGMGSHTTMWAVLTDQLRHRLENMRIAEGINAIDELREVGKDLPGYAQCTRMTEDQKTAIDEAEEKLDDAREDLENATPIALALFLQLYAKAYMDWRNLIPLTTFDFGPATSTPGQSTALGILREYEYEDTDHTEEEMTDAVFNILDFGTLDNAASITERDDARPSAPGIYYQGGYALNMARMLEQHFKIMENTYPDAWEGANITAKKIEDWLTEKDASGIDDTIKILFDRFGRD